jgi:hypothetical protein
MMVARRSGTVVSTNRMLSRKKGRHYGESHQKALQISVRLLPLVGVSGGGRERASRQASGPSARLGICVCMPLLPCGWESASFPTRRQCRKGCDALSRHKAAEISLATLRQRWRRCRWRSYGRLLHSPCGVGAHTAPHSRPVDCEDGHPQGWPLLFCSISPVVIRAKRRSLSRMGHPAIPSVPKNAYSNHGNHEHGLVPTHP